MSSSSPTDLLLTLPPWRDSAPADVGGARNDDEDVDEAPDVADVVVAAEDIVENTVPLGECDKADF